VTSVSLDFLQFDKVLPILSFWMICGFILLDETWQGGVLGLCVFRVGFSRVFVPNLVFVFVFLPVFVSVFM